MNNEFTIGNNKIGANHPVYIIAELSANHNNDFSFTIESIKAMSKVGANAVKVQLYKPESLTLNVDHPEFYANPNSIWAGQRLFDLYKKGAMPYEWFPKLKEVAAECGLDFFATPFDLKGVNFLEELEVPVYKIASLEINHIPLIEAVAKTGKPVIISSGAAIDEDIKLAVETIRNTGNENIALLKCTTAYPAPLEEINLNAMTHFSKKYGCIPGLSDHSMGIVVPIASVALGARIIEKHFILDRNSNCIDKDFSLDPNEFKAMVDAVRDTEKALGNNEVILNDKLKKSREKLRSIYVSSDIKKGELFSEDNLKIIRPCNGVHPKYFGEIIGKQAKNSLKTGDALKDSDF
jgi:pseudaminic acid synthase